MLAAVRVLVLLFCTLFFNEPSLMLFAQSALRGGSLRGIVYESRPQPTRTTLSDSIASPDALMPDRKSVV